MNGYNKEAEGSVETLLSATTVIVDEPSLWSNIAKCTPSSNLSALIYQSRSFNTYHAEYFLSSDGCLTRLIIYDHFHMLVRR